MSQPLESNGQRSIQRFLHDVMNDPARVDKKLVDEFIAYDPVHGTMLNNHIARANLNGTAIAYGTGACIAHHMFLKTKVAGVVAGLRFVLFASLSGVALRALVAKTWYPYNHLEVMIASAEYKEWSRKRASGESDFGLSFT